jgi:hypothetical protein
MKSIFTFKKLGRFVAALAVVLLVAMIFASSAPLCAQDAAFSGTAVAAPQAGAPAGNWLLANFQGLINVFFAVIVVARLVVKITPTPDDDTFLEKFVNFFRHLGLNIKDS